MHKILLFGEITSQTSNDTINSKLVFTELLKAGGKDLEIYINTLGGEVSEAFAISDLLNEYRDNNKAYIKTIALGECASAGVILLLTGDVREVKDNCRPFVHNVWGFMQGEAKDFIDYANDIELTNQQVAQFYSERTGIEYDLARDLMGANTSLTPEDCLLLGFATPQQNEISVDDESQLVLINSIKKSKINMTNDSKEKSLFNLIKGFFLNEKIVHTAEGGDLVFPDLEADEKVEVGDTATLEGQPADGEIVTADGDTIEFDNGEVVQVEENEEETVEEVEAEIDEELSKLDNQIIEQLRVEVNTLRTEVADLRNFKNKVTSTTSSEVEVEQKEVNSNNSDSNKSALYLQSKLNQKAKTY